MFVIETFHNLPVNNIWICKKRDISKYRMYYVKPLKTLSTFHYNFQVLTNK